MGRTDPAAPSEPTAAKGETTIQYLFMMLASGFDRKFGGPIVKRPRLPRDTDYDADGVNGPYAMHSYVSPPGLSLERSLRLAVKRCDRIEEGWPYGWSLDDEAKILIDGKLNDQAESSIDIGDYIKEATHATH